MWVHFSDLNDDKTKSKCSNHLYGPQDSKYCADNGVYYAYNFVEDGDLMGHVDYPWGGNLLLNQTGIDLKVRSLSIEDLSGQFVYSGLQKPRREHIARRSETNTPTPSTSPTPRIPKVS